MAALVCNKFIQPFLCNIFDKTEKKNYKFSKLVNLVKLEQVVPEYMSLQAIFIILLIIMR